MIRKLQSNNNFIYIILIRRKLCGDMVCLLETKQNDIVRRESVVKLLLYRACMSTLSRQRNKNNSVVAMTSNRTVVASLVCLVVFCQRYWNSIGDVLQSTWLKIINVCGDDDESLYFYGKSIKLYRSIYCSATK